MALGGATASNAFVLISADSAFSVGGPDSIPLGNLSPGEDSLITFSLTMTELGMAQGDSTTFGIINIIPGSEYGYGLSESFFVYGTYTITTGALWEDQPICSYFTLHSPYPNPFNPTTTIRFDLKHNGRVRICIYDVTGRLVRVLSDSYRTAGSHEAVWDGRNGHGRRVSTGVYLCTLEAGGVSSSRKLILLR